MSLQSMIAGANLPFSNPASLFKNPAQEGLAAFGISQGGMGSLGSVMSYVDPGYDPSSVLSSMTSATSSITAELTTKVSALSTQLPLSMAAASIQNATKDVDTILSGTTAGIPDQIAGAFPPVNTCPVDYVKDSFKSVTESNAIVSAGNDAVASNFDNTGAMSTLYNALNAIPGVAVSNGKELLDTINSGGAAVMAAVTAAVASSSSLLTQLKSSFTSVQTTAVADMTTSFNSVVASSAATLSSAISTITGNNTVGLISNTSPCVQSVMSSAINPVAVDQNALALKSGLSSKEVILPGDESVVAANTPKPISLDSSVNKPVVPASQVAAPVVGPTIEKYSDSQLNDFRGQMNAQKDVSNAAGKAAGDWFKTNVEEWKIAVQFAMKKTAAGSTDANPLGTSTDPAVLAAWKAVYDGNPDPDNWLYKKNYFNTTFVPPHQEARKKWEQMRSEYNQRAKYGKYPYTFQIAQGLSIPEDQQYTYLDTTK